MTIKIVRDVEKNLTAKLKWNAEGGYMCPDDISPKKGQEKAVNW